MSTTIGTAVISDRSTEPISKKTPSDIINFCVAKVLSYDGLPPAKKESIGPFRADDILSLVAKELGGVNKLTSEYREMVLAALGRRGFDISKSDIGKRTRSQLGIIPKKEIQAVVEPETVKKSKKALKEHREQGEDLASKVTPAPVTELPVEAQSLLTVQ